MTNDELRAAVVDHLAGHYDHSLLPGDGPIWGPEPLADVAARHAAALVWRCGAGRRREVALLLDDAAREPRGDVVRALSHETRYDWSRDGDDSAMLARLLEAIAAAVRAAAPGGG